jgi:hypothetical protein
MTTRNSTYLVGFSEMLLKFIFEFPAKVPKAPVIWTTRRNRLHLGCLSYYAAFAIRRFALSSGARVAR